MSLIQNCLDKIKNAIYGREVRQSIVDAIDQCYKDATGNPKSVAKVVNELGAIREDIEELGSQMDDVVANVTNGNESVTNSEIVVARAGLTALNTRINKIEDGERINKNTIDFYHLKKSIANILNAKEALEPEKTEKGFVDFEGTIVKNQDSTYTINYYNVENLECVTIAGTALSGTSVYALMGDDESISYYMPYVDDEVLEKTIDITDGIKYLLTVSQEDKKITVYLHNSLKKIIESIENEIEKINNNIRKEGKLLIPEKTEKGFVGFEGTIVKNQDSTYTINYYNVENLEEVMIVGTLLKATSYALIDENETVLSFEGTSENIQINKELEILENAKYLLVVTQAISKLNIDVYEKLLAVDLISELKEEIEKINNTIRKEEKLLIPEKTEKGFVRTDGTIVKNQDSTYTINYYNVENISEIKLKGDILAYTAYGFTDTEENLLFYVGNNTLLNVNEIVKVPKDTKYLITTIQLSSGKSLEVYKFINISESLTNTQNELIEIKSKMRTNNWKGKTIWLCGTSIPLGDGKTNTYPYMLGEILDCTVINQAVAGSSICCKLKNSNNWHNMPTDFSSAYKCFSNTSGEQEWVISQMEKGGIYEGNTMDADYIRSLSYEKKLIPYLNGTYPCPDLFIIEHGPNDLRTIEDYDESNPYELTSYYGAMNFIIKTIFEYQPNARVMIMGHYENQSPKRTIKAGEDDYGERTIAARGIVPGKQQKVAEMWNIPIFQTWKYMGWSQMKISTKGRWTNGYWQENYYSDPTEIDMLSYYVPDKTHPHSDKSGEANLRIAQGLAEFIENNIR